MGILRRKGHPAVLLLALVAGSALVLGGWAGGQASARQTTARHTRQGLTASQTQKLLTLIARARTEATAHSAESVNGTLSEFTAYVDSLQAAGSINAATSKSLVLKARITESQTAAQLETDTTTTAAGTSGPATTPAQATTPQSQLSTSQPAPPSTPTTPPPATPQTVQSAIQSWWATATATARVGTHEPAGYGDQQTGAGDSGYGHGYGRWAHGSGGNGHP
jgi:ribulose kinase